MSSLPPHATDFLEHVPADTVPMDLLRSAVSLLAHGDPDEKAGEAPAVNMRRSERLLAQIPTVLGHIAAVRDGITVAPKPELGIAGNLIWLVTGETPTAEARKAFDVSLILYAEHEFNASTFAARVVTSTGSDMHSSIVAAIGALKGPLHGGANEKVMDILGAVGSSDQAAAWLESALGAEKKKIMGFGHRVYKTGDVLALQVLRVYRQEKPSNGPGSATSRRRLANIPRRRGDGEGEEPVPESRLAGGSACTTRLGLEPAAVLHAAFFVASRITGWCAHVLEQQAHNRLIRPKSRYSGTPVRQVPQAQE